MFAVVYISSEEKEFDEKMERRRETKNESSGDKTLCEYCLQCQSPGPEYISFLFTCVICLGGLQSLVLPLICCLLIRDVLITEGHDIIL